MSLFSSSAWILPVLTSELFNRRGTKDTSSTAKERQIHQAPLTCCASPTPTGAQDAGLPTDLTCLRARKNLTALTPYLQGILPGFRSSASRLPG